MFERVLSPILIGKVEVPNRIARTAHGTGFATDEITDQWIGYHAERAKGGCGLTILDGSTVHHSSRLEIALFRDSVIPGFQKLMTAVRPHGMRVFQQLWHGGNLYPGYDGPPLAVSTVPGFFGVVGRAMTDGEIHELIQAFVDAALRCQKGGLDGVEIHGAHGYLFQQFFSPYYNTRTDKWGGSFENRTRCLMEVLRAVRKACGPAFAVGLRLSASGVPGGITEKDNMLILDKVQEEGLIDYVNVSTGDYFHSDRVIGGMHHPTGYEIPSVEKTLVVARVPRLVTGRFRTLEEAEQVIREDAADIVSMVRAHIADPMIVAKTKAGKVDEVRPCVACNQGCLGGAMRTGKIGCLVNPAVGFESTLSETLITRVTSPKKVLVVGGGPGGMEAARMAATLGHKVILAEAAPDLGGRVQLAKRAPKLHTLGDATDWLERAVYRLGVEVRLNTYMEADDVRAIGADAVIIATGSVPRGDGFQLAKPGDRPRGMDQAHVLSSDDVFTDPNRDFGKSAVVLDTVGQYEAVAVTEHFLARGMEVTFLTHHSAFAPMMEQAWRAVPALERFYKYGGFKVLTRHFLAEVGKGTAIVRPLEASSNQTTTISADTVVLVTQNESNTSLYDELRNELPNIVVIGDARAPRDVQFAITEGHHAARAIH